MSKGGCGEEVVGRDDDGMIRKVALIEWEGGPVRAQEAATAFTHNFRSDPQFSVRVPGRVNLVGEHIDYCGYGVFPMAIEQDVFVSSRVVNSETEGGPTLQITNVLKQYSDFECAIAEIGEILSKRKVGVAPEWYLYFLCGVQGIVEHLALLGRTSVSFQVAVDGRVPSSAGLSSSSALVCAAALTTLVANNITMTKEEVASLCAKSERYIGTEGGGMDQAIAFLATAGTAQQIEFVPSLHGEKVRLPSKAVFVIANCLADVNKAASTGYNIRVAECRLSTWILAKRSGLVDCFQFNRLKDLQLALSFSNEQMEARIHKEIHEEAYRVDEISGILEVSTCELLDKPLMKIIATESSGLKLFQRIIHVIQETQRVHKFRQVCEEEAESASGLEKLGCLMNESHWSLSKSYECSHPFLDQLVQLSERTAYGARLTGAGWGGCMVALVDEQKLSGYMETLLTQFYQPVHGFTAIDARHVFVTQPGPGATILTSVPAE